MAVPPEKVGEIAVRETFDKKMIIVPGTLAKISSVLVRALPRRWIVSMFNKVGK